MINIKRASDKDAELIAELSRRTFYDTFAEFNSREDMELFMERKFSKELLMKEVGAPGNIFLLAYYNNEVAGYARLREDNNPPALKGRRTLEVARLYALKDFIGKGIGKELMVAAIDIARKMKKDIVWLGVWEKNQRAIDFYARWGFEKFSDHQFILGNDIQNDWLMKKQLT